MKTNVPQIYVLTGIILIILGSSTIYMAVTQFYLGYHDIDLAFNRELIANDAMYSVLVNYPELRNNLPVHFREMTDTNSDGIDRPIIDSYISGMQRTSYALDGLGLGVFVITSGMFLMLIGYIKVISAMTSVHKN